VTVEPQRTFETILPEGSLLTIREWGDANPFLPAGVCARDALTGGQMPVLGGQRACVHRSLIGETQRLLYGIAGIKFPTGLSLFSTFDELVGLISGAIAEGRLVVLQYPPDRSILPRLLCKESQAENAFLVAPGLLSKLNDKGKLGILVPEWARLPRHCARLRDLDDGAPPDRPVVLKASTRYGSGGGLDVRICHGGDDWSAALSFFRSVEAFLDEVVIEEYRDFSRSWCANFVIETDGRSWSPLGASEQLIVDEHLYIGNIKGPDHAPPAGSDSLIAAIASRAMAVGYRGIVGFDFAQASDGSLFCFDVNLRINGCTTQLLLHDAACSRANAHTSRTVRFDVNIGNDKLVSVLRPFLTAGRFVPISLLDAASHPSRPKASVLTGLVVGTETSELNALADQLSCAVSPS
jgi:hypothetical protein